MGCLRRPVLLLLLLLAGWAGWRWGGAIYPALEDRVRAAVARYRGEEPPDESPDPALGRDTVERYQDFAAGGAGDSLVLRGVEVTSALRYALPESLPSTLGETTIRFRDGRVILTASVPLSSLPRVSELGELLAVLPDTVPLELRGVLESFPGGQAFRVEGIEASRLPVPRRFHPLLLETLRRNPPEGLPPDALHLPLPDGVESVYIAGDHLVLRGSRGG